MTVFFNYILPACTVLLLSSCGILNNSNKGKDGDSEEKTKKEYDFVSHLSENPPVAPQQVRVNEAFDVVVKNLDENMSLATIRFSAVDREYSLRIKPDQITCDDVECKAHFKFPVELHGGEYWVSGVTFRDKSREQCICVSPLSSPDNGIFHADHSSEFYWNTEIAPVRVIVEDNHQADQTLPVVTSFTFNDDKKGFRFQVQESGTFVEFVIQKRVIHLKQGTGFTSTSSGRIDEKTEANVFEYEYLLNDPKFTSDEEEDRLEFKGNFHLAVIDSSNNVVQYKFENGVLEKVQ